MILQFYFQKIKFTKIISFSNKSKLVNRLSLLSFISLFAINLNAQTLGITTSGSTNYPQTNIGNTASGGVVLQGITSQ